VLVFVDSQRVAESLVERIRKRDPQITVNAICKSNDRASKAQRAKILKGLEKDKSQILIATEMLARGIDIKGATHVVNFGVPKDFASYLHRAGRVGRMGRNGIVVSRPADEEEDERYLSYADQLGISMQTADMNDLLEMSP